MGLLFETIVPVGWIRSLQLLRLFVREHDDEQICQFPRSLVQRVMAAPMAVDNAEKYT